LEGEIKTCSVLVKNGKYYACFSCELEPQPLPKTGKKVGIDLGLISFVATSEGEKQPTPKFYRQAEQKLTQLQNQTDRKQHHRSKTNQTRASERYKKAKLKIALECEKMANQRKDLTHKLAKELVEKYDFLACEKLEIKSMVEKGERKNNRYSVKSINDVGWRLFVNLLLCKAEEAGKEVKLVDPKNTTQTCSSCHNLASPKLARSERIYNCSFCGYSEDRDVNAAKNIL
jgi:putative transposase